MVLSKYDLKQLIQEKKMIVDYKEENIQANSYDLSMGNEYCCDDEAPELAVRELGDKTSDDEFEIPADAICYVICNETLHLPNNITADISLAFGLIKQGIMLAKQPPIDPGYNGKIVALLHNLSDEAVRIRKGDHILSIVFEELKQEIREEDLYSGSYQNLQHLEDYCQVIKRGAVYSLAADYKQTTERLRKELKQTKEELAKESSEKMSRILTIITVIIGIVTFLLTIITILLSIQTFSGAGADEVRDAPEYQNVVNSTEDVEISYGKK